MYLSLLWLPLLSFFVSGCFGRKLGCKGVKYFSSGLLFISFILSAVIFGETVGSNSIVCLHLWSWFDIGNLHNSIGFHFDHVVCSMLILIFGVSSLVHLFSTSYMEEDPHLPRFMSYLSLFTFFMVVLVTSNNLIQLFVGWEGVGLCSYLLINFWFTRIQANKAAIKAMIMNKIGDVGVLLSIVLLWNLIGNVEYNTIFFAAYFLSGYEVLLEWCSFLLLIGIIGKSAQIGLHMWLPDAMEGPTPVSALIHAATMVTAGVFLIIRLSPLFETTPTVLMLVILLGSLTAFFSATIGLMQNDLKKVIAYSTCSQLGYMITICGFSQYELGLFHLVNHGFFKSLLFLSAGSVIHAISDDQDIRKMGGMKIIIPFTYASILIGSISLMGLPFITGFYSKDLILEMIYGKHYFSFALWLTLSAASLTAFYSFRLLYYSFMNNPQSSIRNYEGSHEGNWNLLLPLLFLIIASIVLGYLLQSLIIGDQTPILLTDLTKWLPLVLGLIGSSLSIVMGYYIHSWWQSGLHRETIKWYSFINGAWYFDNIINLFIVKPFLNFGYYITYKFIDNQLLEMIGPTKSGSNVIKGSSVISQYHLGKTSVYILALIFFAILFVTKI